MALNRPYLGAGWKFPPQLNAQGGIALVAEEDDVVEAIRIILSTHPGERQMRPEFGSELYRLQFATLNASVFGQAARYVQDALTRWEPRIQTLEVKAFVDPEVESRMNIAIRYRLVSSNAERNLVYPFYSIPEER